MEWASSPSDGNYSLCCRARAHLSRVLDEILEQSANISSPSTGTQVASLVPPLTDGTTAAEGNSPSGFSQLNGLEDGVGLGNNTLPTMTEDNWQNMEFFLDGLIDNNTDMMDWNLGL